MRVIDIPADAGKGLGAFDTLHGFASGAALADQLRRGGEAHSGHAARAFLEQITDDPAATVEALRAYMAAWLAANTASPGRRPGRLGSRRGSRSWPQLASWRRHWASCRGPRARRRLPRRAAFGDWLAARGDNGPEEIAAGLRQVRSFLEMHGTSRFEEAWPGDTGTGPRFGRDRTALRRTINRAGFRRLEQDGKGENWEYYVLPEAWRSEVCTGFDANAIAKAMIAKGWMKAGEGKHLTRDIRVPGVGSKVRVYCIKSSFMTGETP